MRGEINAAADETLNGAYTEAESHDSTDIVLNFGDVDYINSTGIALIVGLLAQARKSHRRLVVFGLSDHYAEIFQITRLADFMSIYPTLCDLADIDVPTHVEGRSIRSLLSNPKSEWDGVALTTHGYQNHAIRTDRWRYIRYANGSEELYDHANDPYEWKNLANDAEHKQTKEELAQHLPKTNKKAKQTTNTPRKKRSKK